MPAGPSETKVFEQDKAYFTYKCKAALSHGIWTRSGILQTGPQNWAKFSVENCGPWRSATRCTQLTKKKQRWAVVLSITDDMLQR